MKQALVLEHPMFNGELRERFLNKIDIKSPEECWLWSESVGSHGYGIFHMPAGTAREKHCSARAHRVSFFIANFHSPIDLNPEVVMHSCDNKRCVNPHHLSAGTAQSNVDDKINKGRQNLRPAKGSAAGRAKLNEDQVLKIRELIALGVSNLELSKAYGVSNPIISRIKTRKIWTHI